MLLLLLLLLVMVVLWNYACDEPCRQVLSATTERRCCRLAEKSSNSNMTLIMVDKPQPSYNLLNVI